MKTKVMLFFLIFLLSIPISLFASTSGAFGSGKPVMIRARKDFTEALIKKAINDKLSSLEQETFSLKLKGGEIPFNAGIKLTDVFVGRDLVNMNNDALNHLSDEEIYAMQHSFTIMLTLKDPEIKNDEDATSYLRLFMNNYKMIEGMAPNFQDINNDYPQMYIKGKVTPTDDSRTEWKLQIESAKIKETTIKLPEFIDAYNENSGQAALPSNVKELGETILSKVNQKLSTTTIKLNDYMDQTIDIQGTKIALKNTMLDFGKPENFLTDVDGMATDISVNGKNVTYSVHPQPEKVTVPLESDEDLLELRLSEDTMSEIGKSQFNTETMNMIEEEVGSAMSKCGLKLTAGVKAENLGGDIIAENELAGGTNHLTDRDKLNFVLKVKAEGFAKIRIKILFFKVSFRVALTSHMFFYYKLNTKNTDSNLNKNISLQFNGMTLDYDLELFRMIENYISKSKLRRYLKEQVLAVIYKQGLDNIDLTGVVTEMDNVLKNIGYNYSDSYDAYFDRQIKDYQNGLYYSIYSDAVFLFKKKGYSPKEYEDTAAFLEFPFISAKSKYIDNYIWTYSDDDNDNIDNINDPCPKTSGNLCDIDKDLLRDDFDDRLYYVGYVEPKAHEEVKYSYDSAIAP